MRPDQDAVESGPVFMKRNFVVGSFVQVIPCKRVEFGFCQRREIEDIGWFKQWIGKVAMFSIGFEQWGGGQKLAKIENGCTPIHCWTIISQAHLEINDRSLILLDRFPGLVRSRRDPTEGKSGEGLSYLIRKSWFFHRSEGLHQGIMFAAHGGG